jgi:hypothetical protein
MQIGDTFGLSDTGAKAEPHSFLDHLLCTFMSSVVKVVNSGPTKGTSLFKDIHH